MPGRRTGSPFAVYARVQCREPKTRQEQVKFSRKTIYFYLSMLLCLYSHSPRLLFTHPLSLNSNSLTHSRLYSNLKLSCALTIFNLKLHTYYLYLHFSKYCSLTPFSVSPNTWTPHKWSLEGDIIAVKQKREHGLNFWISYESWSIVYGNALQKEGKQRVKKGKRETERWRDGTVTR